MIAMKASAGRFAFALASVFAVTGALAQQPVVL